MDKYVYVYTIRNGKFYSFKGQIFRTGKTTIVIREEGNRAHTIIASSKEGKVRNLMVWLYEDNKEKAIDILLDYCHMDAIKARVQLASIEQRKEVLKNAKENIQRDTL